MPADKWPKRSLLQDAGPAVITQPLWRGEDPRVGFRDGNYYSVWQVGAERQLFKSPSLIDRGIGKPLPFSNGIEFPLFAPLFIDNLEGQVYNAWFAFDGNVWTNPAADPYDDIEQWTLTSSIPFSGYSIDFELFQNPQPGSYQDSYYMVWSGEQTPGEDFAFTNLYASKILSLSPGAQILATSDNEDGNKIASFGLTDWSDVIKEAPGAALRDGSVTLVYSGNGAQTDEYALGLLMLKPGADPSQSSSWIDHNAGQCDGDVVNGPEFSQTQDVFGPGVARFVPSPDGSETWMFYDSKSFSTYNRGSGTPGQQDNNQELDRLVWAKPIGWRTVVCGGQSFTIPAMGQPLAQDGTTPLPAGDPGIIPGPRRIEAETFRPFGYVMGPAIQNIARVDGNTDVITIRNPTCSSGAKRAYTNALAFDVTTVPQTSGLVFNNAPAASSLTIATASPSAGSYDLYIDDIFSQTLALPATGGWDSFQETAFAVDIAAGNQIKIVFEIGKGAPADIDYIDLTS